METKTIRFYMDSDYNARGRYMGFRKGNYQRLAGELFSWLNSSDYNFIRYDDDILRACHVGNDEAKLKDSIYRIFN